MENNKKTLRDIAKEHPTFTFNLHYDVWEASGSTNKKQVHADELSAEELSEKYGDFTYDGWYTLCRDPDIADIWATADKEHIYENKGEEKVKKNTDFNKSYKDIEGADIGTFELEDEINDICLQMGEEGVNPELIGRVSYLGLKAKSALLDAQVTDAAIMEVLDNEELSAVSKMRSNIKEQYNGRFRNEETAAEIERYCPDFLDNCPDAVSLSERRIESMFEDGYKIWCLNKDGSIYEPGDADEALEFKKRGGLVVTSSFMFEKFFRDAELYENERV